MEKIIDEFNNRHYIEKELSRGGQGVVYVTKDKDVVIKEILQSNEPIKDEKGIKKSHILIKNVIYKPIPFDIEIAKPLALLKDRAGYVMKMIDMQPLEKLMPQKLKEDEKVEICDFLEEFAKKSKEGAELISYYNQTGSLKKRVFILANIAKTLYRLHLRGLVYFDLSFNNVFFKDKDIYFIDIDNLKYNSSIKPKDSLFSPDFEVPEVANGVDTNSFYSDIYAFGILAFYLLTLHHPFEGKKVFESGDSWDSDEWGEVENRWDYPWIYDNQDFSNEAIPLLPKELTISDELFSLFRQLFEEGKKDKYKRPSLNMWIKALNLSAVKLIECPKCKMSYFDDRFDSCPYCESQKPSRIIIKSYRYEDKIKTDERYFVSELKDIIEIPYFITNLFSLKKKSILKIAFKKTIEFIFDKDKEEIYFNSNSKSYSAIKKIGIDKVKRGIFIIIKDKTTRYLDIKVEE